MSARYDTNDLGHFFRHGCEIGATHLFVLYERTGMTNNRYDYNDCHYYVLPGEDAREVVRKRLEVSYRCPKLMEVYDLQRPMADQLGEYRVFNF